LSYLFHAYVALLPHLLYKQIGLLLFLPFPFGWLFFSLIRFGKVSSRSHFIETLKWNTLLPCGFC
jgi:hypothetical protein